MKAIAKYLINLEGLGLSSTFANQFASDLNDLDENGRKELLKEIEESSPADYSLEYYIEVAQAYIKAPKTAEQAKKIEALQAL